MLFVTSYPVQHTAAYQHNRFAGKQPWENRKDLARAMGLSSDTPQAVRDDLELRFIAILTGEMGREEALKPLFDTVWEGKTLDKLTLADLDELAFACGTVSDQGKIPGASFKLLIKNRAKFLEAYKQNQQQNRFPLLYSALSNET